MILRPAEQDGYILAFHKAIIFEALPKLAQAIRDRFRRQAVKESDYRYRWLLRASCQRPCSRRAAEQRNELAALPVEHRAPSANRLPHDSTSGTARDCCTAGF